MTQWGGSNGSQDPPGAWSHPCQVRGQENQGMPCVLQDAQASFAAHHFPTPPSLLSLPVLAPCKSLFA